MISKTVTYTDYNGDVVTEKFYFHLSKADLTRREISEDGGFSERLKLIAQNPKAKDIVEVLDDILVHSYGVKSEDGKTFRRLKEPEAFMYHPAYDSIFMELVNDADKFMAFMKGILPADLAAEAEKQITDIPKP